MIVVRDPKTFYFDLYRPKYSDENLKREIEFIIKINEFLVKNKMNNWDWTIIVKI